MTDGPDVDQPEEEPGGVERGNLIVHARLKQLEAENRSLFDAIRDKSWVLAERRLDQALSNPRRSGKIEDSHLFRVAIDCMKIDAARRQAAERPVDPPGTVNILNIISGLPAERATGLLVTAVRQMEQAGLNATDQRKALENMVGPDEAAKLLAVEVNGARKEVQVAPKSSSV